jgi:hypothetical protein
VFLLSLTCFWRKKKSESLAFLEVDWQDDAQRDDSGHKDVDDDVLLESAKYTVLISY